jgi:hypothetical protein
MEADMTNYLIFFNQQWVGDHPAEWYEQRGVLARAVVREMADAGVLRFADGLVEEIDEAFFADPTGGTVQFGSGPFAPTEQFLGGMTIVDVTDDAAARYWAGRIAEACGWPQEVRRFKS